MIEGIDILNRTDIMAHPSWWTTLLVVFAIIAAPSLVTALSCTNDWVGIISMIMFAISMAALLVLGIIEPKEPTGRYQYEVMMDESVPFEDVLENYDIVEQKGKIWILKDKK